MQVSKSSKKKKVVVSDEEADYSPEPQDGDENGGVDDEGEAAATVKDGRIRRIRNASHQPRCVSVGLGRKGWGSEVCGREKRRERERWFV